MQLRQLIEDRRNSNKPNARVLGLLPLIDKGLEVEAMRAAYTLNKFFTLLVFFSIVCSAGLTRAVAADVVKLSLTS